MAKGDVSLPLDWCKVQPKLVGSEVDLLWWELHCFCCNLHYSSLVATVHADSISLWTLFTSFVFLLAFLLRVLCFSLCQQATNTESFFYFFFVDKISRTG